jgi:HEPN domain-containing protein
MIEEARSRGAEGDMIEESTAETRWPTDEDRLFREGHPAYDAPVTSHVGEREYRLPMAYKRAGDLLLERNAEDPVDRRNVICPALFCYRQSIELFLKKLVRLGKGEHPHGHRLNELWQSFMRVSRDRGFGDSMGITAAEALILELHAADERSDGFRYPVDGKGHPFASSDRRIDVDNLLDVMTGLTSFLECAAMELSHQDDTTSPQ